MGCRSHKAGRQLCRTHSEWDRPTDHWYCDGEKIHRKHKIPGIEGELETYRRAERYIVVTGHQLAGTPDTLADIDRLMDETVARLDEAARHEKTKTNGHAFGFGDKASQGLPEELWRLIREGVPEGSRSEQFHRVVAG